jgi:colanic acid/amylovoran biosynthesis glycosyltransferase
MICSFYGDDAFAKQHDGKYGDLFENAERILVLGAYMKARLIQLGCAEHKLQIHHLGIDLGKIRFENRIVKPGSKIRFLIASSFLPKKGIDLALKALSEFVNRYDFSLDIIGDGPMKNELLKLIEEGGLSDRVTLHGYKPYDYFIHLAYTCQVFIQASRTTETNSKEGTPMAIVDAMATGMAVVSTKHSDIPEIVIDQETGYLAEENDQQSLIKCIAKIFEQPERIAKFSLKGRAWVEQEFDVKKQSAKLEEYYVELISSKR